MKITFTKTVDVSDLYKPAPAKSMIPQWYKDIDSYVDREKKPLEDGTIPTTIKKCMPVFDALSGGYIIPTYVDVFITQKEQLDNYGEKKIMPYYRWADLNPITFHKQNQAPNHPYKNGDYPYPKWTNPWSISTPKGYSVLIMQPLHRESVFTILSGIVDTDRYSAPINFPFVLNDANFEGLIPAGTPMAQIIPFKRDSWNMNFGNEKDFNKQMENTKSISSRFFDAYKTIYREKKEYN